MYVIKIRVLMLIKLIINFFLNDFSLSFCNFILFFNLINYLVFFYEYI